MSLIDCSTAQTPRIAYDPPGSTNTTDKEITPPVRSDDWLGEAATIGLSTAFAGGRLSAVEVLNDSVFTLHVQPENAPINNSAWYAFKVWADTVRTIRLHLTYREGEHRYHPKLSRDGQEWRPLDAASFDPDTTEGTATLWLEVGPDTLWVAAQELITSHRMTSWVEAFARQPFVTRTRIGQSREGRPISRLDLTEAAHPTEFVLLIGRQHPPEVTGTLALQAFLETLAGDSGLARRFRQRFKVIAIPMVNPDGVDGGHWRHNAGGVDLNRDWGPFNQPETRLVSNEFLKLKQDSANVVYFAADFHSTQEDVFYTLARDLPTRPAGFTDAWLQKIDAALPDYTINEEAFDLGDPVSKNWFYEQFGCPAITYEVGDESDRTLIHRVAEAGAVAMMELLLEVQP